jgi:hypothetical protein
MPKEKVSISPNQMAMLKAVEHTRNMNDKKAVLYHQTTFGSVLRRKLVGWDGRNFRITEAGHQVLQRYEHSDIARKIVSSSLTRYFDPEKPTIAGPQALKRSA